MTSKERTKERFLETYVATFLANTAAIKYNDSKSLYIDNVVTISNQPIAEAFILAEKAWNSMNLN